MLSHLTLQPCEEGAYRCVHFTPDPCICASGSRGRGPPVPPYRVRESLRSSLHNACLEEEGPRAGLPHRTWPSPVHSAPPLSCLLPTCRKIEASLGNFLLQKIQNPLHHTALPRACKCAVLRYVNSLHPQPYRAGAVTTPASSDEETEAQSSGMSCANRWSQAAECLGLSS